MSILTMLITEAAVMGVAKYVLTKFTLTQTWVRA